MKTTSRRTPRRLAAGLAVGALALAACGSDSNDADESATAAAAALPLPLPPLALGGEGGGASFCSRTVAATAASRFLRPPLLEEDAEDEEDDGDAADGLRRLAAVGAPLAAAVDEGAPLRFRCRSE